LNDGITLPAEARLIPTPKLWERDPPIRSRVNIPTQWVEIVISEGKNRQIRRMTAAVGHPTLRLVRVKIGNWTLEGIAPGEYKATTINLPKSAMTEAPRRRNNRPAQDRRLVNGDKTKPADGQKRPPRNNPNPNDDKKRARPPARSQNTSKPAAPKPSVATKVIVKPSRNKPTE
jgi:23S rRNA pseudouridine2457 synthase